MKIKVDLDEFRILRVRYHMNQQSFAKIIGCSGTGYQRKENGYTDFKLSEVVKIANYFHFNASDMQRFFMEEYSVNGKPRKK